MTPSMFPDLIFNFPETEGVKYAGSKLKLLPYILQLAHKVKPKTVFDGFAGTTRVSQAFAQLGYKVISNDIAVWSKIFGLCYLKNRGDRKFYQEIIDQMKFSRGRAATYRIGILFFLNFVAELRGIKPIRND